MLLLALITQFTFAQDMTISGIVSDSNGLPIPGVNVKVKGTSTGTSTDFDGSYKIKGKSTDVLVLSFQGMNTQELKISGTKMNARLTTNTTDLEGLVVIGYGTQKRREVTGAISTIKGEKLAAIKGQSFDQSLSGLSAGLNVSQPNGVLGNQAVIRVRGVSSISLSNYPLIVIDGVPTWNGDNINQTNAANNPLSSMNQNDIESVEILKDAAASAIYGSRASAGVMLITTKRGKKGKTSVNFSSSVSVASAYNLIPLLNAQQFTDIKNEGLANAGTPANGIDRGFYTINDAKGNLVDTNWYNTTYRNGISQEQSLNISGANETTKYFFSLGRLEQEGIFRRNDFKRLTTRFTLEHKLRKWITVGANVNYTTSRTDGLSTGSANGSSFASGGAARLAFAQAPNVSAFNNDGSYNLSPANIIGQGNNLTVLQWNNAQYLLDKNTFSVDNAHIMSNFYADFKITEGLTFKALYGTDNLTTENKDFLDALHGDGFQFTGAATNTFNRYYITNIQNVLSFNKALNVKHNFSALLGNEVQYSKTDTWGASRRVVADQFYNEFQGGFGTIVPSGNLLVENYLQSYFGRLNYDYNKKYYLSLNGRRDGFSAFAKGKEFGNFYGASLGWYISEEGFIKNTSASKSINSLKLRASYGIVGNNQGIGSYASKGFYDAGLNGANATLFFSQAENKNLSWEKSKKTDFGLDFSILKNRFSGEVSYYKGDVDNLILAVSQAASTGIPSGGNLGLGLSTNTILQNVGSMVNSGIELTLNANILSEGNFKWNTSINYTTQKNEVTALDETKSDILIASSNLERVNIVRVGESVGSFYVVQTAGVNPANGRRIFVYRDGTQVQYNHAAAGAARWTKVSDGTVTRAPSQALDAVVVGPSIPTFYGGFTNNFKYKGFELDATLFFSGGNYIYNGTKAGLRDQRVWNNADEVLTRWQKPGDVTDIPRIVFGDNVSNGSSFPSAQNVEKGDFIKIRNISFGYNLPTSFIEKIGLTRFNINVSAQNAFTFTNYSGFDPEISSNGNSGTSAGVDRNSAPLARTFSLGFNIGL